jgi:predicted enzyme related to lactoylglutathione lyase
VTWRTPVDNAERFDRFVQEARREGHQIQARSSRMQIEQLSALIFRSEDPGRLARFYREHLGIPFAPHGHGKMPAHQEAWFEGIHFAVLKPTKDEHVLAPTFRVRGLQSYIERLGSRGVSLLRPTLQLDENMHVASFRDIDGNTFNLIELAAREQP